MFFVLAVRATLSPAEMQSSNMSNQSDGIWLAAATVAFGLGESYLSNRWISESYGEDKGALRRTPQFVELSRVKAMVEEGRELSTFERGILRLRARLSMNQNEPTAAVLQAAAPTVNVDTLGSVKTTVEMLELVRDDLEGVIFVRAFANNISVQRALEDTFAALQGNVGWSDPLAAAARGHIDSLPGRAGMDALQFGYSQGVAWNDRPDLGAVTRAREAGNAPTALSTMKYVFCFWLNKCKHE